MEVLLLALLVLTLTLNGVTLWILYQVSCQTAYILERVTAIQRALNSFDRPESLSVAGVDPGSSFLPTEQEIIAMEQRLVAQSRERVPMDGSARSGRNLRNRMASLTGRSPRS